MWSSAHDFGGYRRVAAVASLALAAAGCSDEPEPERARTDRILVIVDALRADRLQDPRIPTPHLDALVSRSMVYEHAFAHGVETRTAMPALLCGGDRNEPWLGTRFPGHHRGFFGSNAWIGPPLLQGFEEVRFVSYRYFGGRNPEGSAGDQPGDQAEEQAKDRVDGRDLTEAFHTWLDQHPEPVFAVLHYMDVHAPYRPPDGPSGKIYALNGPLPEKANPERLERTRTAYDASVAWFDTLLGGLLEALASRPHPLLLVLTSDHGESLGEEGLLGHGTRVVPQTVQVPLLVYRSDGEAARPSHPVAHGSVATLLAGGQAEPAEEIPVLPDSVVRWPLLVTPEATWDLRTRDRVTADREPEDEPREGRQPRRVVQPEVQPPVDFSRLPEYDPPRDASGRMRALGYVEDPEPGE